MKKLAGPGCCTKCHTTHSSRSGVNLSVITHLIQWIISGQSLAVFAQLTAGKSLDFTMGHLFSSQNCPSHGEIWMTIQHTVPWANPSPHPKGHLNVFAEITIVTDRLTDRLHYSICNNRPHLRSTVMQPEKKMSFKNWLNSVRLTSEH